MHLSPISQLWPRDLCRAFVFVYIESAIWDEVSNMSRAVKRTANVKNCDKMFHICVSNALLTAKS